MTGSRPPALPSGSTTSGPRVGLFGLLGSGNLGNDGSLEAVLGYLRVEHPNVVVDLMCPHPDEIVRRYGLPAVRLHWNRSEYQTAAGARAIITKAIGKVLDTIRTAAWVRRHEAVIVPGMGVLEATLPLRPWGFPYSLFLLCASGRLFDTKVALVSVGANADGKPATRRLLTSAARLAFYRSFRDAHSKKAVQLAGVDVSKDSVYPDLAFALPTPPDGNDGVRTVGVGVMYYHGTENDRHRADVVHSVYVAKLRKFIQWLVDRGYRVRLFTGDHEDDLVVKAVIEYVHAWRPDLEPSWLVAEPVTSLTDLMRQMALVDNVVATRYHNVLCAVKMGKPTVSIGYSAKNDDLMASMGLGEFCQDIDTLDVKRLIDQFIALEARREHLHAAMARQNATIAGELADQFAVLSEVLFSSERTPVNKHSPAPEPLPKETP